MSIEQFIKGSVWTTSTPMRVRGRDLPVGTKFEVMYPRRRESDLIAVAFPDVDFTQRRERREHLPRSRTRKGRFHKADEFIRLSRLEGSQLVSLPVTPLEYFIRLKGTNQLWSGGRERLPGFYDCTFGEGNHYVSADNALIGVVTLMFKQWKRVRNRVVEGSPSWEIVGYEPFAGAVLEVHEITPEWWDNIIRMARYARALPEDITRKDRTSSAAQRMRKLANVVPLDDRSWRYLALMDERLAWPNARAAKDKWLSKMSEAGITDFLSVDDTAFLLVHDTDRVMMKLLFADGVETHTL